MNYAGLPTGIWKSTDAGVNRAQIAVLPMAQLAVHPANPDHVIAASDDTFLRGQDGGITWSDTPLNFRITP